MVPESPIRVPSRVNSTATLLMGVGFVLVLLAVSQAEAWHWASAKTLVCLAGGIIVTALWVIVETRSAQPLVRSPAE